MARSFYDVVIAGTDLAGVICGLLAAKNGLRVLLVGNCEPSNTYKYEDFYFVRSPNLFSGFSSSQIIKKIFEELAMLPEMKTLPQLYNPSLQLILPSARISFYKEKDFRMNEIKREFPKSYEKITKVFELIENIYKELNPILLKLPPLPPQGFRDKIRYRKIFRKLYPLVSAKEIELFHDLKDRDYAKAFLFVPLYFLSRKTEINPLSFIVNTAKILEGFYFINEGVDRLKKLFYEKIEGNSGNVKLNEKIARIIFSGGKAKEIELKESGNFIGFHLLICSMNPINFFSLFEGIKGRKRKKIEKLFSLKPSHFLFTFNLGVKRWVIPEGMGKICFLIKNPEISFEDYNYILISLDNAMSSEQAKDKCTITISTFLKNENLTFSVEHFKKIQSEVLKRVEYFVPFLSQFTEEISSPCFIYNKQKDEWVFNKEGLISIFSSTMDKTLGLGEFSIRTPFRNVLYLGDNFLTALGFEGSFLSAEMGFEIIKKMIKKRY